MNAKEQANKLVMDIEILLKSNVELNKKVEHLNQQIEEVKELIKKQGSKK